MKQKFVTGLLFLIPIAISFWFLSVLLSLLLSPFQSFLETFFIWLNLFPNGLYVFSQGECVLLISSITSCICVLFLFILCGFISEKYISTSLKLSLDEVFLNIPLVNKVYHLCKRVTSGFFAEKGTKETSVFLTDFMSEKQKVLGIATNKVYIQKDGATKEYHATFLSSTPNPTGAYLLFVPNESQDVIDSISKDEAIRFVISCGTSPSKL